MSVGAPVILGQGHPGNSRVNDKIIVSCNRRKGCYVDERYRKKLPAISYNGN